MTEILKYLEAVAPVQLEALQALDDPKVLQIAQSLAVAAIESAQLQAATQAGLKAADAAKELRNKEAAYNQGFRDGAASLINENAALKGLTGAHDQVTKAAVKVEKDRAATVYAMLAAGNPRFELAAKLLKTSSMTAIEIAEACQEIPDATNVASEFSQLMAREHRHALPGDANEIKDGRKPTGTKEDKADFMASIGMQPGEKFKPDMHSLHRAR